MGTWPGIPRGAHSHHGPAVHSSDRTALHWAAISGNRKIVRLLIAAKADVNAKNDDGCAFPYRHRRVGRLNPFCLPCRATPLHYAGCNSGGSDAIAELLLCDAAVAVQNKFG
jgi:hypothetical protein